jgi:hypothetical protein
MKFDEQAPPFHLEAYINQILIWPRIQTLNKKPIYDWEKNKRVDFFTVFGLHCSELWDMDMEREGYIRRMNELLDAVLSLLDANTKMWEKLERISEDYELLKVKYAKQEGELSMRKRGRRKEWLWTYRPGGSVLKSFKNIKNLSCSYRLKP